MAQVVTIADIPQHADQEITIRGWLYKKTDKGRLKFLLIRDGTGIVQGVVFKKEVSPSCFANAQELTQESSLIVTGSVRKDDRAPGGYELSVSDIEIVQIAKEYPIAPKEHGIDFLMENRHLWLRSSQQWAILR
ncbi:MAG: asparagine--tRNA ligase, partial [Anaerolineae bacterium]|nr:asparagine--tRNA ligase [Anaerolineae bacterium]